MSPSNHNRRGHTLIEMVLAITIIGVMSVSVGSAMVFVSHASVQADDGTPSLAEQTQALNQIADDLATARYVIERRQQAVTVVVDDRTGDGVPDRIRYAWGGSAGDALTYQLNDASPIDLLDQVRTLNFGYTTSSVTTTLAAGTGGGSETGEGPERLLEANDDTTSSLEFFPMVSSQALGHRFTPTLSADATGYKITRVELYAQASGKDNGRFPVTLRDIASNTPTGPEYATAMAPESNMPNSTAEWVGIDFSDSAVIPVGEEKVLTMGFGTGGGRQGRLFYHSNGTPAHVRSFDNNASWQTASFGGVLCRIYGVEVYETAGAPAASFDITRDHVTAIDVSFQVTGTGQPTMAQPVQLIRAPQVLDRFWEADFSVDPTAMDLDGGGSTDWAYTSGGFPTGALADGVWSSDGDLEAQPAMFGSGNTTALITVDLRMRSTTTDGPRVRGPMLVIGSFVMPIMTQLRQDGQGGQELLIYNDLTPTTPIKTIEGLNQGWVDIKLILLPQEEVLSVRVNGEDTGGVVLEWVSDPGLSETIWLGTAGSGAEYDEVRIGVGGSVNPAAN